MMLDELIRYAIEQRATDIHLEPRAPVTLRVQGELKRGPQAVDAATLKTFARRLLRDQEWSAFGQRGSADLCRTISGVQCRINILRSDRGTGFAIRLLSNAINTLRSCNLHPCLKDLIKHETGLVLLTGPTGSGKSTTLAALIEEINANESRHIITLESPIEYRHSPKKSLVRQREVGRHTPSYEQGLMDALREDPDVLMVGEMRDPEAMRLTLSAAETGHLVLATMHSASAMDAVYRIMMSFPPERQSSVLAQIADTLVAVISHRLKYREREGLLVPSCEILTGTYSARNVIRKGEVSKLPSILQTGGPEGMFTFERYEAWLDTKTEWVYPELPNPGEAEDTYVPQDETAGDEAPFSVGAESDGAENLPEEDVTIDSREILPPRVTHTPRPSLPRVDMSDESATIASSVRGSKKMRIHKDGRIEIPEMDLDLNDLVKQFKGRGDSGS